MNYRKYIYEYYLSRFTSLIYQAPEKLLERERLIYRKNFLGFLPREKSARILDIGSGYGKFIYFLEKEGYKNISGVDCSLEQVELAQRLGIKNVFCADITETLKNNFHEYDAIVALDVVEHFRKDELFGLLTDLFNALKPGGIFIMRSPNATALFASRYRYGDFSHEISFTPESIRQLLSAVGFKDVRVSAAGPFIYSAASLIRYIIWQIFRHIFILYLAAETGCFKGHIFTQDLIVAARR